MRFLVTAGNTREKIDAVRDWGNIFTGNTGLAIARSLAEIGEVDLVTSNQQHLEQLKSEAGKIRAFGFTSHTTLKEILGAIMGKGTYDAVFMTAAVADYRPTDVWEIVERGGAENAAEQTWKVRRVSAQKVSSAYREIAVAGEQTEKIVDLFRGKWGYRGLLVKFKLEVGLSKEELIAAGKRSREASGADYLVANTLAMIDGEKAGAWLLGDGTEEWVGRGRLGTRMVELVRQRYTGGSGK